ncbi:MAG: tetraacyldisaccharide 4'-kinase, partial [Bergeyella zoohelcum]|nr:tetraacyldisaccharide 4'-kinase [Bergeyella zoohelcum]
VKNIIAEYKKLGEYKLILTTEKDYVRLKTFPKIQHLVYYWPINVNIDNRELFNQIINDYVSKN